MVFARACGLGFEGIPRHSGLSGRRRSAREVAPQPTLASPSIRSATQMMGETATTRAGEAAMVGVAFGNSRPAIPLFSSRRTFAGAFPPLPWSARRQ